MDLHWLSAPPVPNERNFHYHKYHKSWELKLDFTIWLILIPFAHLDPVNQLRYEETKARDTVSNLHSGFFRELRQWCIQAALEKWICCSRCSPFLTFLKVALWSSSSFFELIPLPWSFCTLRRHWSQKSLSWCTTSRFQIDTRGCWTSSSSYLDWQRTATLDYLFLGWSYFALGTSWDYNHSFYQFIGAKVSRPRTRCVASHSSASLRRRNNTYEEDIASLYEILKGAKNPGLEQCLNPFAVHFCHYTALGKAEYTVF